MAGKKLTDSEIIKALERLENTKDYLKEQYQEQVKKCPYPELKPIAKQTYEDNKKAFDIAIKAIEEINRLQAENERLHKEVGYWEAETKEARADIDQAVAEAYKEFAERLKEKSKQGKGYLGNVYHSVDVAEIDNLLKEMVGENNA